MRINTLFAQFANDIILLYFHKAVLHISQFPPPLKLGGGFLIFEIWTKRGIMKNCSEIGGLVERGGVLLERGRGSKLFQQFSLRKACFHYYWNTFFCQVNIHTCCNQQIISFMWFTFYQKMIYYEISLPFNLIFKYNVVKMLLLMTFISISISLKTSNILKNK